MRYLPAITATCMLIVCMSMASAMSNDISGLKELISKNEDTSMNSRDLAFFLAIHNYGAVPMEGCVEVELGDRICRLIPNGSEPGLCNIAFRNKLKNLQS